MVTVPMRATPVFADTFRVSVPLPLPVAPLAMVIQVVFIIMSYAFTVALGGRVVDMNIGSPKLFSFRVRGSTVNVGPLPTASLTMFGADARDSREQRAWFALSRGRRVLIRIGPWLAMLLLAMVCIGPMPALRSFARGFYQLLFIVDLTPLVRELLAIVDAAPAYVTFGILLTKMTAVSLLPVAGAAGGGAIDEMRNNPASATWMIVSMLGLLAWIGGRVVWAFALAL